MVAEQISAWASVGTLVVITVTALAAFVQLRHMSVLNGLTVLSDFSKEYERVEGPAVAALPLIDAQLKDLDARLALAKGTAPDWARPVMPLVRLFEILGNYTNRKIVPHDLVTDMWAPVILRWWYDLEPLIAILRRAHGTTLLENWEAIVVRSRDTIDTHRSAYPKGLRRLSVVDPWPDDPRPGQLGNADTA